MFFRWMQDKESMSAFDTMHVAVSILPVDLNNTKDSLPWWIDEISRGRTLGNEEEKTDSTTLTGSCRLLLCCDIVDQTNTKGSPYVAFCKNSEREFSFESTAFFLSRK